MALDSKREPFSWTLVEKGAKRGKYDYRVGADDGGGEEVRRGLNKRELRKALRDNGDFHEDIKDIMKKASGLRKKNRRAIERDIEEDRQRALREARR